MIKDRVTTYNITVSPERASEALRLLVNNKLPKERSRGLAEVYPAGSGGLIPTKSEEKARYLMALQGELERKLKSYPGVMSAHVSIATPEKDLIRNVDDAKPRATASVAFVYNAIDETGEAPVSIADIKLLIASAVEDLAPEDVQVVPAPNRPTVLLGGKEGSLLACAVAHVVFGISVVNHTQGDRLKQRFFYLAIFAVLCFLLGVVGIFRSVSLNKRLGMAQNELTRVQLTAHGAEITQGG